LAEILAKRGLTQRAFASSVRLHQGSLYRVLHQDGKPPLKMIERWADTLHLHGQEREQFLEEAFLLHCPDYIQTLVRKLRQ
jgi:hypothetical protein